MKIHCKGILPERFEDAPFIGTLIIAPDCKNQCKGCCNQHLLENPTLEIEDIDIIENIKSNKFSDGIIFAGLDPLTYPDELLHMIELALESNLQIMIYTNLPDKNSLLLKVPELSKYENRGIYVKYGEYDESKKVPEYYSYGVLLATSNQYIDIL